MGVSGLFRSLAALTAKKNPGTHSVGDWVFHLQKVLS